MVVEITVGAKVTVAGLPPHVEDELIEANTSPNPEYACRERLGLWLGETSETLELFRFDDDGLVVPRWTGETDR